MIFELSVESLELVLDNLIGYNYEDLVLFEDLLNLIKIRDFLAVYDDSIYSVNNIERIFEDNDNSKFIRKLLLNSSMSKMNSSTVNNKIGFRNSCSGCIVTEDDFLQFLRTNLFEQTDLGSYFDLLEKIYINLYFLPVVKSSINKIEWRNKVVSTTILKHLDCIQLHFRNCFNLYKKEGNTVIMQQFKSKSGVDASAENDRETVQKYRTIKIINEKELTLFFDIKFELHTKLNITKLNERIYFSIGNENIQNNRVVIAHIGKHLFDPKSKIKFDYDLLPGEIEIAF